MWPLMENNISEEDRSSMANFILSTDKLTNGKKVIEFEKKWSAWLGVDFSCFVNSGSSANYLAAACMRETKGLGEVIVPALGWSSDISSLTNLGFTPVFVDIDLTTMGLCADGVQAAITERTVGVVVVHALGFNALTPELLDVIQQTELFLIEDCCEAHGACIDNTRKVGTVGDVSLFSFYYGHHITTVEGGIVSTNNQALIDVLKMYRSHGLTREASPAIQRQYAAEYPDLYPEFTFAVPGFNFRSTEINAHLGLIQLGRLDDNVNQRNQNLKTFLDHLDRDRFFTDFNTAGVSSFALPLILRNNDEAFFDGLCARLRDAKFEFRRGTAGGGNLAWQPFVKALPSKAMPVVEQVHYFGLYLGNGGHVDESMLRQAMRIVNFDS